MIFLEMIAFSSCSLSFFAHKLFQRGLKRGIKDVKSNVQCNIDHVVKESSKSSIYSSIDDFSTD